MFLVSTMEDSDRQKTRTNWVALLRKGILPPEVDEETADALFAHLADLGLWEPAGENQWQLGGDIRGPDFKEIKKHLQQLCNTENGFALKYFLPGLSGPAGSGDSRKAGLLEGGKASATHRELLEHKTSNLSNLQIVKKYGRQMESFIELEKSFMERLAGKHTTRKEARKIFNFILGQKKQKEKPRAWEQLSRRRHK